MGKKKTEKKQPEKNKTKLDKTEYCVDDIKLLTSVVMGEH